MNFSTHCNLSMRSVVAQLPGRCSEYLFFSDELRWISSGARSHSRFSLGSVPCGLHSTASAQVSRTMSTSLPGALRRSPCMFVSIPITQLSPSSTEEGWHPTGLGRFRGGSVADGRQPNYKAKSRTSCNWGVLRRIMLRRSLSGLNRLTRTRHARSRSNEWSHQWRGESEVRNTRVSLIWIRVLIVGYAKPGDRRDGLVFDVTGC